MSIYTFEEWITDNDFLTERGQEVEERIYEFIKSRKPCLRLPTSTKESASKAYDISIHAGYLEGEPVQHTMTGAPLFRAFACEYWNNVTDGKRYFYLGLSEAERPMTGEYYYLECMGTMEGFYKVSEFENLEEAIQTASNYEAKLYRYSFDDKGNLEGSEELFNPFSDQQ